MILNKKVNFSALFC